MISYLRFGDTLISQLNRHLAFYAVYHGEGVRLHAEPVNTEDFRSDFQHDRDRIVHARSFRRLKHKTQVFMAMDGDHFRTRLTHTLEVSQLSRTIARAFGLNEDLTEAIALGHDLGHTPFGHIGEVFLDQVMSGQDPLDGLINEKIRSQLGGFKHNYQSLRVIDELERRYSYNGLNLTTQVRVGILRHTGIRPDIQYPGMDRNLLDPHPPLLSIEAQVVAIADEIAQQTHDLEDGLRSHIVNLSQVRNLSIFKNFHPLQKNEEIRNEMIRYLVNLLITDVIEHSNRNLIDFLNTHQIDNHAAFCEKRELLALNLVSFSHAIEKEYRELRIFVYQEIINSARINRLEGKTRYFLRKLFKAYMNNPLQLPDYALKRFALENNEISLRLQPFSERQSIIQKNRQRPLFVRLICDYIAGMTDSFAQDEFRSLYLPT